MSVDADLPIDDVQTMEQRLGGALRRQRLNAILLSAFAALALVIAGLGVYGVMSYATAQRTREFGIRVAFGATRGSILRLVLGRAFGLTAAGLTVGVLGAAALTRVIASQLYGVLPTDLVTFGLVGTVLTCVALLASYVPARRATRVEPLVVLGSE